MSEYHPVPPVPPPSPQNFSNDGAKPDMESVQSLVAIIYRHMHSVLEDTEALTVLRLNCISHLKIQAQECSKYSDHQVLSNLSCGLESVEAAAEATRAEERTDRLEKAERMLQDSASLDENGATQGNPNSYILCCTYFYLSVVELLRGNEWQVAVHFLRAVSVSPRIMYTELAPGICRSLFPLLIRHDVEGSLGDRGTNGAALSDFDDDKVDDVMRCIASRYKPWIRTSLADEKSQCSMNKMQRSRSLDSLTGKKRIPGFRSYQNLQKLHSYTSQEDITADAEEESSVGSTIPMFRSHRNMVKYSDKSCIRGATGSSNIKDLKGNLTESKSDAPISQQSHDGFSVGEVIPENYAEDAITSPRIERNNADDHQEEALYRISQAPSSKLRPERDHYTSLDGNVEEEYKKCRHHSVSSISSKKYHFPRHLHKKESSRLKNSSVPDGNFFIEQEGVVEKIISELCFTEELGNGEEDCMVEMKTIYEMLNSKSGLKYCLLKDIILNQLLKAISTSREERVVRISVAILSNIVTANKSVIEDVKRKGLQLYDLMNALKRNVHEAVILIYLINPSPEEIIKHDLLPCLAEVVCTSRNYKIELTSLQLTPPAASLMIIEVLVTALDHQTSRRHLAALSSPRVLSGLMQAPRKDNLEEFISLAAVLVKCTQIDGQCRKFISKFSPVAPFVSLLQSNQRRATLVALEFFNELHRMPKSSSIGLLERMQELGSTNNMCALFLLIKNSEPEFRLLAANLLLQLEVLGDSSAKTTYGDEAAEALLVSLTCEESPSIQALAAFILSNLGGTCSWTGMPHTGAWLLKKAGLTLACHRNLIKNYDFFDQSLQDAAVDSWSSKMAQRILHLGIPIFHALDKGLKSKFKRLSRYCLVATAWLGCQLVKGPDELRDAACEIILHTIEPYLCPGSELEERLLACLCIYSYTSGRGMSKIINLSERVRESLRRLSNVTWMAEELLEVVEYFQPNKWHISCVHRQILEAGNKSSGAVTALIYYKGLLYSGYADGSIKVWDIVGQTATLVEEIKEHKKAVTCFALYEPGNCLLSGSADKTIKMWQMLQRNTECVGVMPIKESVRRIDSWGELVFAATKSRKLKVIDASRIAKDIIQNKRVKCVRVVQGKVYAGCMDSSIQELIMANNRQQEIKAPSKSWMHDKSISSIAIYKDWLYSAGIAVEGSKMKDWRRGSNPQISIVPEKGAGIRAMEVVEDFIYLNCRASKSSLEIWLRGSQHSVGRLSAGSKITSLLSANDMILCGTEKGVIKGWIPV